jgi:hypothetical protein
MVHEQEDAGARQLPDQAVEHRLGFGVHPVEILEHHAQWSARGSRAKSVRVTASWVSRRRSEGSSVFPAPIFHVDVEQGEERREHRPQRVVEGQHLAGDLLAHLPLGIALLDPEVILQEVDDGKVGRRRAIRDGTRLDDEPSAGCV